MSNLLLLSRKLNRNSFPKANKSKSRLIKEEDLYSTERKISGFHLLLHGWKMKIQLKRSPGEQETRFSSIPSLSISKHVPNVRLLRGTKFEEDLYS